MQRNVHVKKKTRIVVLHFHNCLNLIVQLVLGGCGKRAPDELLSAHISANNVARGDKVD